jgi:energy-converting hydrogenase Eha subunit H
MRWLIIPVLALGLSACGTDREILRSDLEQKAATLEAAVNVGSIAGTMYAALPDCGGTAVICKNADVAVAVNEAIAAGRALLTDIRLALAEGLTDEQRAGQFAAAILNLANRINEAVEKINAPEPAPEAVPA